MGRGMLGLVSLALAAVPQEHAREQASPLASGIIKSVELSGSPDTSVRHFRLDKSSTELGPDAPEPLGVLRWICGPDPSGKGARLEIEATFFQERVLGPLFFKRPGDEAKVRQAAEQTLPPLFDYLEASLGDADYLVANRFSIADVALGALFVNYRHGRGEVDAARWPKLAAWVERVHGRPSFKALIEEDAGILKGAGQA